MRIYKLEPVFDDIGDLVFQPVGSEDDKFIMHIIDGRRKNIPWTTLWPSAVEYVRLIEPGESDRPLGDYPASDNPWVFSIRAADRLRDVLELNGVILPIRFESRDDIIVGYGVTNIVDALDYEHSNIVYFDKYDAPLVGIQSVNTFAFFAERLRGVDLFTIPEARLKFFVSQAVVDRIYEAGLVGFDPILVWTDE